MAEEETVSNSGPYRTNAKPEKIKSLYEQKLDELERFILTSTKDNWERYIHSKDNYAMIVLLPVGADRDIYLNGVGIWFDDELIRRHDDGGRDPISIKFWKLYKELFECEVINKINKILSLGEEK